MFAYGHLNLFLDTFPRIEPRGDGFVAVFHLLATLKMDIRLLSRKGGHS